MSITVKYSSLEQEKERVNYFRSLPEKQRRHFIAMQYLHLGQGSQRYLAGLFSCSRDTIRLGVKELKVANAEAPSAFEVDYTSQRQAGGGRKKKN